MAWATPTITTRRGRYVRHTQIVAVGTLNGTTPIQKELGASDGIPLAIFAGSVQIRSDNNTSTDKTTVFIRVGQPTIGGFGENDTYSHELTIGSDPDFFPLKSLFDRQVAAEANFLGHGFTFPLQEFTLIAQSDQADETDEIVTIYIGLLSHVLEV